MECIIIAMAYMSHISNIIIKQYTDEKVKGRGSDKTRVKSYQHFFSGQTLKAVVVFAVVVVPIPPAHCNAFFLLKLTYANSLADQ